MFIHIQKHIPTGLTNDIKWYITTSLSWYVPIFENWVSLHSYILHCGYVTKTSKPEYCYITRSSIVVRSRHSYFCTFTEVIFTIEPTSDFFMAWNITAVLSKNAGLILSTFHNLASFSIGCWYNTLQMTNGPNTEQVNSLTSLHHTLIFHKTKLVIYCLLQLKTCRHYTACTAFLYLHHGLKFLQINIKDISTSSITIKNKDTRPMVYSPVLKVTILEMSANEIKLIKCVYVSNVSFYACLFSFLSYSHQFW